MKYDLFREMLNKLNVHDSLFVPGNCQTLRTIAYRWARINGKKVHTYSETQYGKAGVRIWRIK